MIGYAVFEKAILEPGIDRVGDERLWRLASVYEARNPGAAIETAIDAGSISDKGVAVAVPARYWRPTPYETVTSRTVQIGATPAPDAKEPE